MERLSNLITKPYFEGWAEEARIAFEEIYSGSTGRYPSRANSAMAIRAPGITPDSGVPFAALIHPSNANSGGYGGMSFVLFPVPDYPPMIAMVVGTLGISPDDDVLGRPGHARWVAAICRWLNQQE
ncbi:MAG TPA: hypothetical protein VIH05_05150, partial [Tepidiformaceae bacterium]